jgi:hypothetical protein
MEAILQADNLDEASNLVHTHHRLTTAGEISCNSGNHGGVGRQSCRRPYVMSVAQELSASPDRKVLLLPLTVMASQHHAGLSGEVIMF